LEKRLRLTKNFEFNLVYKKGRRRVCPLFSMYAKKNRIGYSRFGISVSKKIGKSVVRNRVKRRLREILRRNYNKIKPGYDIVISAKSEITKYNYWEIESQVVDNLKKMELWVEQNEKIE